MPSQNTNIIANLRGKHDPHYKLATRVDALEKDIRGISSIHATLSKSFGMQRKTLLRVLALEKQVAELKSQKESPQGGDWDEEAGEWEDSTSGSRSSSTSGEKEIFADGEGGDVEDGGGGTATLIDPGYASRVEGEDDEGNYLSPEERKRRFKKRKITGADIKKGSSVDKAQKIGAEQAAMQKAAIDKAKIDIATKYEGADGITPEGEEGKESTAITPLIAPVQAIEKSVDSIVSILQSTQDTNKEAAADARKEAEIKKRKGAESKLEKITGTVGQAAEKILQPVKSIFGKIIGFLTTLVFGRAAVKVFEWFSDPKNSEKVSSIFQFIKDWWPVLVAGIMAFVGPGVTFFAGLILLLSWAIPKIQDAIKWVTGLFGGASKEVKDLEAAGDKTATDLDKSIVGDLEKDGRDILKEGPQEEDTPQPKEQTEATQQGEDAKTKVEESEVPPTQKFAQGGVVPGSGNRDTVPAMLTPGEFVMSKGAVQHYGSSTLAGMNAAAGGTNKPTVGYHGGGTVQNVSNYMNGGGVVQNVGGSGDMTFRPRFQYSGGGPVLNVPRMVSVPKSQPKHHHSPTYLKFSGGGEVPDQALIVEQGENGQDGQDGQAVTPGQRLLEFIKPLKHIPFVGGKIVEKGGELVAGVQDLIASAHSSMHPASENQAQLAPSAPSTAPPPPPSAAEGVVNAAAAVSGGNTAKAAMATDPDQSLPNFSCEAMRSGSKIKTLGITA